MLRLFLRKFLPTIIELFNVSLSLIND